MFWDRRRGSITDGRWEQMRSVLKHLYEEQGLRLNQVRTIMANRHQFFATEQMFKKRFAKWNMKKNYTRKDKEQLSLALLGTSAETPPTTLPQLPSTASQLRRIKRFLREQGAINTSSDTSLMETVDTDSQQRTSRPGLASTYLSQTLTNSAPERDDQHGSLCRSPSIVALRGPPRQSKVVQAVEDVLLSARQYYQWFFTEQHVNLILHDRLTVDAVFVRVQCARRLLAGGDNARAFLMLQLACSSLSPMFKVHQFQLLLEFLRTFIKPGWAIFPEVKNEVLEQMSLMSQAVLGSGHPLSRLVESFRDANTLAEAGPRFLNLLSRVINEHVPELNEAFGLHLILVECYIALDELETAEATCLRCLSGRHAGVESPLSYQIVQKARKNLGCIRYKQGRKGEAQKIWLEVYRQDVMFCDGHISGTDAVTNCTHLASLYEGRGDYERSAVFYRIAFEGALRTWDPIIMDLHEYFNSLQYSLTRTEATAELENLLAEYAEMMLEWDRRQLSGIQEREGLAASLLTCSHVSRQRKCDFDAGLHRHFVC